MSDESKIVSIADGTDVVDARTGEVLVEGTPEDLLLAARDAAQALERVIKLNEKPPLMFNGKRYLEVHHWLTIGKFYHCTVSTSEPEFMEIDGIKGFRAKATVFDERNGTVVGGAIAFCMRDEPNWKSKPLYSLASMAQTRAMSKALSNKFRFVAVVAGYEGTPSEEIQDAGIASQRQVAMPKSKPTTASVPEKVDLPASPDAGNPQSTSTERTDAVSKFFEQLHKTAREKGIPDAKMKKAIEVLTGKKSSKDLTDAETITLIKAIERGAIK